MYKKYINLWRGLTAIFGILLAFIICIMPLAIQWEGNINDFLGVKVPTMSAGGVAVYQSSFGNINEENQKKLLSAEDKFVSRQEQEGSVLLQNNGALPLTSGERKVTLFGKSSADPLYTHNSGGAKAEGSRLLSYYDAMKAVGFQINEAVYNAYKSDTATRRSKGARASITTGIRYDIGESPVSVVSAHTSTFNQFGDAAIIMLSRMGGEGTDLVPVGTNGRSQLALQENEEALLNLVKNSGAFEKIIVLLNTGNAMEIGWLDDYGVDACLWIGLPGLNGFAGVPKLLKGDASPSGRLVDTYAADSLSSPAMMNFGDFTYSNANDFVTSGSNANRASNYIVQAEGIYVGYKYYETRYEDLILQRGSANSSKGTYKSSGAWNYADEMSFPFGFGLSYCDQDGGFSQEIVSGSFEYDETKKGEEFSLQVKVTNNSSTYSGKSVVQLYVQTPYVSGGIEKPAIQLAGFAKTDELAPGSDPVTVTIIVDKYLLASYSTDAYSGEGGYILDSGNYYFAIGNDVHDALNNILAKKEAVGMYDHNGVGVSGSVAKTEVWELTSADETYKVSQFTGNRVENQLKEADMNHFLPNGQNTTYLSRSEWADTYPETVSVTATAAMISKLNGEQYTKSANAKKVSDYKMNVYGTDNDGNQKTILFSDMKDVEFNDVEAWDAFLNQLSIDDLLIPTVDSMGTAKVQSVEKPAHAQQDGPDGVMGNLPYKVDGKTIGCTLYVNECLSASSWNADLMAELGDFMAEDALYSGKVQLWSPGGNLHRTPFSGRNFEYYSEDSYFSYLISVTEVEAMQAKGLCAAIKHFVGNDQETNRLGVSTFNNEQAWREGALKGFEGAFTKGSSLGTMTSYNRIGCAPSSESDAIQNKILRDEWNFKGATITDNSGASSWLYAVNGLVNGTDMFNCGDNRAELKKTIMDNDDGDLLGALRTANKHYYYAFARTSLIDMTVVDFTPWWKTALIVIIVVLSVVTAATASLFIVGYLQKKKTASSNEGGV